MAVSWSCDIHKNIKLGHVRLWSGCSKQKYSLEAKLASAERQFAVQPMRNHTPAFEF